MNDDPREAGSNGDRLARTDTLRDVRWTRLVVLFAGAAAAPTACNAITGASDLTADLCGDDCGEDASVIAIADAPSDRTGPENVDAGVDSNTGRPTFCAGLLLYTTFDNDLKSTVGSSLLATTKDTFVAGKFGQGLQATGTTSTGYFPMTGAGGTLYPDKAGTIAFWFKSSFATQLKMDRILVKPVVDQVASVNETAPQVRFDSDMAILGITNQNPDAGYTTAGLTSPNGGVPAGWNLLDFNHLVGTWNQDKKSLQFWLNGGMSPSTYAESNTAWTPQVSPTGFLRISSSVSPSEGTFDELAVWSRELGPNEVQALFSSPVPIATACGL